jgi:hypothetical protein
MDGILAKGSKLTTSGFVSQQKMIGSFLLQRLNQDQSGHTTDAPKSVTRDQCLMARLVSNKFFAESINHDWPCCSVTH